MKAKDGNIKLSEKKSGKTAQQNAAPRSAAAKGSTSNGNGMTKADISTMRAWKKTYENREKFLN